MSDTAQRKANPKKRRAESATPPTPQSAKTARIDDGPQAEGVAAAALTSTEPADPMAALEQNGRVEEAADGDIPGDAPVRVDEVEIEATREIEAAKGLGGGDAPEGGKMKLVHQVRHQVRTRAWMGPGNGTLGRSRPGRSTPQLPLRPNLAAQA